MLGISALLHLTAAIGASTLLRAPALDIELVLPIDVEFGATEALQAAPASAPPADTAAPARDPAAAGAGLDGGVVDAGPGDAGARDAGPDAGGRDAGTGRARARDAGAQLLSASLDGGVEPARIPPGAQIALRVDMARIRQSPLAEDVRRLLAAIPDWRALLEGSGIDPLTQLDRLLVATPNLQREKVVIAGRHEGGEQVVLDAVEQLGRAHGVAAAWRMEGNVAIAPWASADATPRVIARVGPRHFTISRMEDLPRVLAIAAARSRKGPRGRPTAHPADALLSMEEREALSLEVEGVAQFVRRGQRVVPERMRLSASEQAGGRIVVRGVFSHPDAAQASGAREAWDELRERFAHNALVLLLGLSAPLSDARIAQQEREVHIELDLSIEQTRLILGYVRELIGPTPRGP